MHNSVRMVGRVSQGTLEKISYSVDFTAYGTPINPKQFLYDGDGVDVTATKSEAGDPTINGKIVTSTRIIALNPNEQYRLEMLATITETGNYEGVFIQIAGEP